MPIQPPPANNFARPPTPPQDPPNVHNVASAIRYEAKILHEDLNTDYTMPEEIVVQAAQYRASVSAAYAAQPEPDAIPAWFLPAMQVAMQVALAPILREVRVTLRKSMNSHQGNGFLRNFHIIPFSVIVNGQEMLQDPTQPPHDLQPLRTLRDIHGLGHEESSRYYHGYYGGQHAPTHPVRKERIAVAIGAATLYQ